MTDNVIAAGAASPQAATGVENVAVVAAGTIGMSWTALFLAHGFTVQVYDTRSGIEEFLRSSLDSIAPTLAALGLPTEHLGQRLHVAGSLEEAVSGAQVIQENGPENLAVKHAMLAEIEAAAAADSLILSSTSALTASRLATPLRHPERLLVAHPFNPPHLIPLVEIVPGEQTGADQMTRAVAFYEAAGKHPVVIHKEIPGFVANRLQAAIFRESIYLVTEGVVDVAGLDEIVTNSLGLRWAAQGPFLSFDLGGGAGGLTTFFEHLGPDLEAMWKMLGTATLDHQTVSVLSQQADAAFGTDLAALNGERDRAQLAILGALASVRAAGG
jgi:ketoreductase RED1